MTSPARVLFLEVDAGDKLLVENWARDGTLPTFARLLRDGLVGDSDSVDGFFVGATRPSLYTGANPANHGIHSLVQLRPGTYDFLRCYTGEHRREGLFMALGPGIGRGRLDRRVSIMDFAPTFCALLGAELPGADGEPIAELEAGGGMRS